MNGFGKLAFVETKLFLRERVAVAALLGIPEMSHTLQVIGDYAPLGAALHAVRQSWMGQDPRPLYLGIMAAWAAVAGIAAVRFFRWE